MQTAELETVKKSVWARLGLWVGGAAALVWFLVRVIPKPQRAGYPCMRAAFPLASAFVLGLTGSIGAWLLAFRQPLARRGSGGRRTGGLAAVVAGGLMLALALFAGLGGLDRLVPAIQGLAGAGQAGVDRPQLPNSPMGVARGIFPGRVVWVHDPDATNADCEPDSPTRPWWSPANSNQAAIDAMLSRGLRDLSGAGSDAAAWDRIFRFHNQQRGKGDQAYRPGEKIMIKTNATSTWYGNIDPQTMEQVRGNQYYGLAETSPQVVLALLRQLVLVAGVPQSDIYVGDPMKHIYQSHYLLWHQEFPQVHYLDNSWNRLGREVVAKRGKSRILYSDRRTVLSVAEDRLYKVFDDTEYLLNVPTMKGHKYAGVTMFAKNHFGSQNRDSANHLHAGLVRPGDGKRTRAGYGQYRVLVDIMGSEALGKKNLLFLMDALYTASEELGRPVKWRLAPFNNDWTSSLFLSLDNVAIESVGYDFLAAEFNGLEPEDSYPRMSGTDDYLEQAADRANWPAGLVYDPDGTGQPLPSLGVHEHWNNPEAKQYSRNLGSGQGIELVPVRL